MATPIFPRLISREVLGWRGLQWGLTKKLEGKTQVQEAITGREAALQLWTRPKYEIILKWSLLKNSRAAYANVLPSYPEDEFKRLAGFFTARRGRFEPFFLSFTTDGDFKTSDELIAASTPAPGADPANLTSKVYQLVRTFGGTVEPVGGLDVTTAAPALTLSTVPLVLGVDYTANSPKDGYITLAAVPTTGSVLRGTFHYYYRVAFKQDSTEFELFAENFIRNKSIALRSRWW